MIPHHGEIKNLDSSECLHLLERTRSGHLACHGNNDLYLVPITCCFEEDGSIYSHSRPGKKIDMMRKNSRVCVQMEEVEGFFKWKSVIVWGQFEELKGSEAAIAMRRLIQRIAEKESNKRRSDLEIDLAVLIESAIIYRIKIEKSTGRYEEIS